jgi:glycosyltransferase involved in cell wall biosynthesis
MKTALVHDWLVSPVGGAENVLEELCSLFPSPIYTLLWNAKAFVGTWASATEIHQSFISKLPWAQKHFRSYLPFFPLAIEQFDLKGYDVILSNSHCVAKGVLPHPDQLHICYCHTPMRYAWDLSQDYLKKANLTKGVKSILARLCLHYLRGWDVHSSPRVDHFIGNSKFVARRIQRTYGRYADVIYPPVNTAYYQPGFKKESFYATASRLVPYKKIDLIVEAFSRMPQKTLYVIGDGPELETLRKKATPNIYLMGYQPNQVLKEVLQQAKAFVFAALEDYGIMPIEAMASGTPVIAFKRGGVTETVQEGISGLFFEEQTPESICKAMELFESHDHWNPLTIAAHAQQFSVERFRKEYKSYVEQKVEEHSRYSTLRRCLQS